MQRESCNSSDAAGNPLCRSIRNVELNYSLGFPFPFGAWKNIEKVNTLKTLEKLLKTFAMQVIWFFLSGYNAIRGEADPPYNPTIKREREGRKSS